jgi:hypothetical protein
MSLVAELQQEALDEKTSVVGLLRKALLVASKLENEDFVQWIEHELNGYGESQIPEYREVHGELRAWNPYRGYQPVGFSDAAAADRFSSMNFHMPISELEHMLAGAKPGGTIVAQFSPEVEQQLLAAMNVKLRPSLHIGPAQLRRIVDAVRTAILKWALELEQKGVTGEGLSFSNKDKAAAGRTTVKIDTYIGSMTQSQIQRDAHGSVQTLSVHELDLAAVGKLIGEIERALQGNDLPAPQLAELQADLASIKAQLGSPKPKHPLIRECLLSIRHIMEHAGGKLTATGILAALTTLIGP